MSRVLILDTLKRPLNPVRPAEARILLDGGQAAVFRRYPFTIILKRAANDEELAGVVPLRLKLDPGSKTTGVSVVNDGTGEIVWAAELTHRGQQVKEALTSRRAIRRSRRYRKTRYRPARFLNRRRREGWLPPSLESRIANTLTWVTRLGRFAPIGASSQELVKFDTQLMQTPEISGVEYQQGELQGYEVREYLLEKYQRKCVYCGKKDVPFEVEHIVPRSRGGSDRVSNLTLACHECNQRKGNQTAQEFGYPDVQAQARRPLKDAAAVNTTRWALFHCLEQVAGLAVETGSGGLTKYNRATRGLAKTHWLDAACVGRSTPPRLWGRLSVLKVASKGRGNRRMCVLDSYGFPQKHRTGIKSFLGFHSGDLIRAVIPKGKFAGVHVGRVSIRQRPSFRVNGVDVHPKYCQLIQRGDGYAYSFS